MWTDEALVSISAIEHYSYCPRQCGLIHVESIYDENLLTLRGTRAHERVDQATARAERGVQVLRGLPIWSDLHGITGRADVVEVAANGRPCPVEYKVGKNTGHLHALYQACAQAFCLEEMFGEDVPEAAVFYVASREREVYPLDADVRRQTIEIISGIRQMKLEGGLPEPVADKRCRNCSLLDACMPFAVGKARTSKFDLFQPSDEVELP